jgi:Permuted papain-like amidase enzyme, YaeF/YiiX, C92 family
MSHLPEQSQSYLAKPVNRLTYFLFLMVLAAAPALCRAHQGVSERKPLSKQNWPTKLQDGDMVFIRSVTPQAQTIADLARPKAGTDPKKVFTHCGIVFRDGKGGWIVYEGRGRNDEDPVSLEKWQTDESGGEAGHDVFVRRLRDRSALTEDALKSMRDKAYALHHTNYDWGFMWTDKFVYCSELIWRAYETAKVESALNKPHAIKEYYEGLSDQAAKDIKKQLNGDKARARRPGGAAFDPEEKAISPEEIYNSPGLVSVDDNSPNAPSPSSSR